MPLCNVWRQIYLRSQVLDAGGKTGVPRENLWKQVWTGNQMHIWHRDWESNPGPLVDSAGEEPLRYLLPQFLLFFYLGQKKNLLISLQTNPNFPPGFPNILYEFLFLKQKNFPPNKKYTSKKLAITICFSGLQSSENKGIFFIYLLNFGL